MTELSEQGKRDLVELLKSPPNPGFEGKTTWEALCIQWNKLNPDNPVEITEPPTYEEIEYLVYADEHEHEGNETA